MGLVIAFVIGLVVSKLFFNYQKVDLHEETRLQVRLEEMEQTLSRLESLFVDEVSELKYEIRKNHERVLLDSERMNKSINSLEEFLLTEIVGDDLDICNTKEK